MTTYEQNADAFDRIVTEVGENPDPGYNEADTRAKIIDRVLREALGWPETGSAIRREEGVHDGYIDYVLRSDASFLVLEAKRIGKTFTLPAAFTHDKYLTVRNLVKQVDIRLMYAQVTRYAHERGIEFCVLSNGTQWLVFPGVRTDNIHVRHSRVVVFNGLRNIRDNFLDFWGLLSYDSVRANSLAKELRAAPTPIEPSFVFNGESRINIPFDRNILALPLVDVLPRYFGDLHGDPSQTDMLQECIVVDQPVQASLVELHATTGDERPSSSLAAVSPIMHFYSLPQVSKKLEALLESFLSDQRAKYLQVVVGRVGIGKTTFLLHFLRIHRRDLADNHFALYLDFRDVSEATDLESFFQASLWGMLIEHPRFSALTSAKTLKDIFKQDIDALQRGPLERLSRTRPEDFELEIGRHLGRQMMDRPVFLRKLADYLYRERFARFILVFDNVDQLTPELQEKVVRYAYSKANEYRAFLILSMWEETYFSSKRSARVLSTIRTVPLQITRQSITSVLVKRLEYLIKKIREGTEPLALLDAGVCSKETFCSFLDLILRSLLVRNKRVRLFLELVALGNIRRALEMFHSFLTAGSLETAKVLAAMQARNEYLVPVHEFVKSVMLGSKRYYSERTSEILNLFAVGDVERPSHFTRPRILQWLYERRHESTPFGSGFMLVAALRKYFAEVGVSAKDTATSLRRLIESTLVETDTRAQGLTEDTQAVRVTPTGRYYLIELHRMFAYIDLVMQDTPFFDPVAFDAVAADCESTEMAVRFRRCERFLDYLGDQEEEELLTIEKLGSDKTWRRRFVPNMRSTYESEKQFIVSKGYG